MAATATSAASRKRASRHERPGPEPTGLGQASTARSNRRPAARRRAPPRRRGLTSPRRTGPTCRSIHAPGHRRRHPSSKPSHDTGRPYAQRAHQRPERAQRQPWPRGSRIAHQQPVHDHQPAARGRIGPGQHRQFQRVCAGRQPRGDRDARQRLHAGRIQIQNRLAAPDSAAGRRPVRPARRCVPARDPCPGRDGSTAPRRCLRTGSSRAPPRPRFAGERSDSPDRWAPVARARRS